MKVEKEKKKNPWGGISLNLTAIWTKLCLKKRGRKKKRSVSNWMATFVFAKTT